MSEGLGLVAAQRPLSADVNDEARAFRIARKLLSAEDRRAWMQPRGLTMKAVSAVAERAVARRHGGEPLPVSSEQVALALAAEAICAGALRELRRLSEHRRKPCAHCRCPLRREWRASLDDRAVDSDDCAPFA